MVLGRPHFGGWAGTASSGVKASFSLAMLTTSSRVPTWSLKEERNRCSTRNGPVYIGDRGGWSEPSTRTNTNLQLARSVGRDGRTDRFGLEGGGV